MMKKVEELIEDKENVVRGEEVWEMKKLERKKNIEEKKMSMEKRKEDDKVKEEWKMEKKWYEYFYVRRRILKKGIWKEYGGRRGKNWRKKKEREEIKDYGRRRNREDNIRWRKKIERDYGKDCKIKKYSNINL